MPLDSFQTASAGRHSPMRFQDMWFMEKLALFDRETSANRQTHHQTTQQKTAVNTDISGPDS